MNNNCPDILNKIVETKKIELQNKTFSIKALIKQIKLISQPLDFFSALKKQKLAVISEIKKASPSAGIISENFQPNEIANAYIKGKTDAISILTDKNYFKGDINYIKELREIITVPIIRKDFIIDEYQIYEARAFGADSFLLIAAILTNKEIKKFLDLGRKLGMEPLVESHSKEEIFKCIEAGVKIFGVNNRNLHTFEVNINTSAELFNLIPENALKVSESGIVDANNAHFLREIGYDAVLVGESLMRCGINSVPNMINQFKNSEFITSASSHK